MKLRNKKTGEIGNLVLNINPNRESYSVLSTENGDTICGNLVVADYDTLAELNEEWEDCEEPKEYWYADEDGEIWHHEVGKYEDRAARKSIGNYFETREEAERAVEKLKAWKRLEKCNFRFKGYDDKDRGICGDIIIFAHVYTNGNLIDEAQPSMLKDLDLLFGGDEWK